MDTQFIQEKKLAQAPPAVVAPNPASLSPGQPRRVPLNSASSGAAAAPAMAREMLRFPGEDGGKSLSEMAQRDLDATLQLLAERAQYITGASGAAIALREGANMVCLASAGASAPELGAHLQIDSGLSAESVRTRKILHCDDAATDSRVNRESCKALGIVSVVVMPLLRGEEVFGVFELLADRPRAFEERDFVALHRLAEMIQTAVEHAEAAKRAEKLVAGPEPSKAAPEVRGPARQDTKRDVAPSASPSVATAISAATKELQVGEIQLHEFGLEEVSAPDPSAPRAFGNVGSCRGCGFPISPGRTLCLDCEAASPNVDQAFQPFDPEMGSNPSWLRSHTYLVATVLLVAATIALVVWRF